MTADLKTVSELIRGLSSTDKKRALSMLASEVIGENAPDCMIPVMQEGRQVNYGLFRVPVGKIEILNLQPGDRLDERSRSARDKRNTGELDALLDKIPLD